MFLLLRSDSMFTSLLLGSGADPETKNSGPVNAEHRCDFLDAGFALVGEPIVSTRVAQGRAPVLHVGSPAF